MFESITATGVIAAAGDWSGELTTILLIVIGFGMFLTLANWVIRKFRAGRGRRGRKARAA